MWRMQEGRTLSPLAEIGPVSCMQSEEMNLRAVVPHQKRRELLLHVRTSDAFVVGYEQQQQQQQMHLSNSGMTSSPVSETTTIAMDEDIDESSAIRNKNGIDNNVQGLVNRRSLINDDDEDEDGDDVDDEDEDEDEEETTDDVVNQNRRHLMRDNIDDDDEDEDEDNNIESNGNYPDDEEEDIEVDVCHETESNPSSPVDLTASSRMINPGEQYIHSFSNRPVGIHGLSCLQSIGGNGAIHSDSGDGGGNGDGSGGNNGANGVIHDNGATVVSTYHSGHATGSMVTSINTNSVNNLSRTCNNAVGNSVTNTSANVQTGKRGLAFSVENILDPNKFTGGRVIHDRISHRRRRRAGSVHEGKYKYNLSTLI
ncbi:hypothetical protein PV327_001095 [Microctonus hyperodae]|uniref:Uncharacterized protein n=1 Tax=Microctonus hyperodae TaxID=165561 RepID=A0AA39G8P6_MICHY|nr:hypothetical protein PV327_001095 [Microctonus hyperodae]